MAGVRLNNHDLNGNQLLNARFQNLPAAPSSPTLGLFYFDTVSGLLKYWDGAQWIAASSGAALSYGSPVASAVGDAAADGVASTVARSDHKHAREAFGAVTAQTAYGASSSNGAATTVTRSDHTHGTVALPTLNGLATQTADYNAQGFKVTNLGAPSAAGDATNKSYVDSVRQGMDPKNSVNAASTGNVNVAIAPSSLDGVTGVAGHRWLLKDQSTASQNGVYDFNGAGSALTRSVDADASGELTVGSSVFVDPGGTANGAQLWVVSATTATPWVPGSSGSTWTQFSGASAVTAGAGLTATGNVFAVGGTAGRISVGADTVDIDAAYVGQASITTLGTIGTGQWNGTDIPITAGGTGAGDAATARANLGVGRAGYAVDIGDGSSTSIVVTHNLGTRDVLPMLRLTSGTYAFVEPDIEATSINTVTYRFAVAPSSAQYRAIIGTIAA